MKLIVFRYFSEPVSKFIRFKGLNVSKISIYIYLIVYCLHNFEVYNLQIYFINGKKVVFISIQVKDMIWEFSRVISRTWRTCVGRGSKPLLYSFGVHELASDIKE